ncbi:hypothetical protein GF407_16465 [candidate division KSB1 bacterium]|nr:hypothetical protein [candidate division KSB1 bacterium]
MADQQDHHALNTIDPAKDDKKELRVRVRFLHIDDQDSIVVYPTDENPDFERLKALLAAHRIQLLNDRESESRFSRLKEQGLAYLENDYHFQVYCTDRILEYDTLCFLQPVGKDNILCSTDEFIRRLKPIVGTFSTIKR